MASLVPSPVPTAMPPAAPVDPLAPALADGRLVVLLVGTDAGPGRWSARADTIIVAALDVHTGRAVLIGVPRNFTRLPLPPELAADYPQGYWPDIANALYTAGLRVPERFPGAVDPGAAVLAGSLAQLLGLPIDYTAAVDMGGFVQLIDALGGVTVDVAEPIATWLSPPFPGEDWRYYEIAPGRQHLDGHAALAYVRSRTGSSDYDRMQRQRCLLGALVREAERPSTLARLPAVLDAVQGSLRTDVPREALPWLLELGARVEPERIAVLGLVPPDYVAGWAPGGYPIPDGERIRHDIAALLAGSALPADSPLALPRACRWSE
jgi:LCP family protein required for cell wall assembly